MNFFYVLITYGPRPSTILRDHPEGRAQLDALDQLRPILPDKEVKIVCDYCRKVRHLDSLPKFKWMLRNLQEVGARPLFIDDLHRIFRRTPLDARESLLSEMRAFDAHIFSMRHKKKLSNFSDGQIAMLLLHAEKVKMSRSPVEVSNTEKARIASIRSRTARSIEIGREMQRLQTQLLDTNDSVTLQMVANLANERGMKTATGKHWTRQTVGKALEAARRSETEQKDEHSYCE